MKFVFFQTRGERDMAEDLVLAHHGIKGQKWGDMHGPPYPLSSSVSTGKSLKKSASGGRGSAIAKYKAQLIKKSQVKTASKSEKEKSKEEEQKAKNEKIKAKVIKSRSASQLYKHAELFSNQELHDLKERYTLEGDIKKLKTSESIQKGRNFIDKVTTAGDMAGKFANLVDNSSRAYNNVAKVMNSLYDSEIPMIAIRKPKKKLTILQSQKQRINLEMM